MRNGVAHVREIARMSLRLMETVKVLRMMGMVMGLSFDWMNLYLFLHVFESAFVCQGREKVGKWVVLSVGSKDAFPPPP